MYRSDFVCHELPLDTTTEAVAVVIVSDGQQPLIICSLYKPPDRSVSNWTEFLTVSFVITLMILFGWPATSISLTLNALPVVLPTQGT